LNEEGFGKFLKRNGRAPNVATKCISWVADFERYLRDQRAGKQLDTADKGDLEAFAEWAKNNTRVPAKSYLYALRYYFDFSSNKEMRHAAGEMRQKSIKKNPLKLRDFRGAKPEYVTKLATAGVRNAEQMLAKGRTRADRQKLSKQTEIPEEAIMEFVKLSDLSRIDGVKNIRARLYYDAGVDTIEKMAKWNPEKLRAYLTDYVTKTGFNGIPPLPKEALHTVETAKRLPRIVEF
jgi:hypothetical protein